MSQAPSFRTAVYFDGLNLYYGMMSKGLRKLLWLDISGVAKAILRPEQELIFVKYFTARVSRPEDKRKRQNTYLDAISTLNAVEIYEGYYQENEANCRSCGAKWIKPEEKITDVNIAVEVLKDAHRNAFDTCILVSADSDLSPVVTAVKETFEDKRVVVAFPPGRKSYKLAQSAHASFKVSKSRLKRCLLPPTLRRNDGFELVCPDDYWHKSFGPKPTKLLPTR